MRRIVSDRLTTALIIEDDSDWDVTLKIQLHEFALASQSLQKARKVKAPKIFRHRTPNTAPNSPYGDEWGILWLGHCGMTCRQDAPYYKRSNDSTALPVDSLPPYWSGPAVHDNVDKAPNTRIICQTRYVICTGAYAVSYNAAQKIIAALSVLPSDEIFPPGTSSIFDVSLGRLCENGYLTCYSSFPSLIGNWRPAGSPSRNSDIQIVQNSEGEYQEAVSSGIAQSTMLNLDKLLEGTHGTDPAIHHSVAPEANLYDKRPHLGGGLYVLDNDTMIESKV
ncbi:hypothetical protein CBS63078_2239 [Aspergillus niger]|nr:hypothetical protein CBS63078_2239 [Aspergillus niger]KAI3018597.1 hypothetical protein CBS147482_2639 [Aspergillus niger]